MLVVPLMKCVRRFCLALLMYDLKVKWHYIYMPSEVRFITKKFRNKRGFVEGVVIVMRNSLKSWEISGGDKESNIVHDCMIVLYSFISTPAEHLISNFENNESLEFLLEGYVAKLGKVENLSELSDEKGERLTYALALCTLLVPSGPSTLQANLLLSMVNLLSLLYGAGHHFEEVTGRNQKHISKHHAHFENMRIQQGYERRKSVGSRRRSSSGRKGQRSSRKSQEEMDVDGDRVKQKTSLNEVDANTSSNSTTSVLGKKEKDSLNKSTHENNGLEDLVESVGGFCVHLVESCPNLGAVLQVLNQCHQHEVTLFFRAVKDRKPHLVGHIQEKLLDQGINNRLVTILAEMYS
ncbi:unnamed protein product [Meganyctiphanes norvegica]|uniref:Uncharacterized protein n=1 Tax=Meganyctiphanes norvegica TaxID=48144 RepID=A0AAV2Q4U0_MEGNR